jgi:hypothetical protein
MELTDMKQEDIIRMAREAGMAGFDGVVHAAFQLEAFAALVAAAATEAANARANTSWALMCKKMVAAEKEACAKVCDDLNFIDNGTPAGTRATNRHCAAAIRARGQA